MSKDEPVMSPVQFSLRAVLLATVLFAIAAAVLSRPIQRLDVNERWRGAFLAGGLLVGAFVGAGMANFARTRIHRIAGKRLLVVPAGNTNVLTMKVAMAVIVVLWCAVVWVLGEPGPPYVSFLSVLVAVPVRWLCRFPRYLELFENGVVYGGTVYFPWKKFTAFRFDGHVMQLYFLMDVLGLTVPPEYVAAVDEILAQHIERWEAPPRDWFAAEQNDSRP